METKFNFNSAICTTREQSKRLLALGLKKETADMVYRSFGYIIDEWGNQQRRFKTPQVANDWMGNYDIPAWSLHRLIELCRIEGSGATLELVSLDQTYDKYIGHIKRMIKEGYFNKEYLV